MPGDRQLFLKMSASSQYVGQVVERQLAPIGIPGVLLALLTHIRDHGPVSPTEISRVSGAPSTTLRDNIQRLVDRGFVRRLPNPADGRSYVLRITTRGEAVTKAADPVLRQAYTALERHLPHPLGDYERALDELNAALERALDELRAT